MKIKKLASIIVMMIIITLLFSSSASAQTTGGSGGGGGWNLASLSGFGLPSSPIFNIIQRVAMWILSLLGIIGVIGFAISGILYLTAAGDDDQMGRAKRAMMYSIIGVIVGLAGLVVITAVNAMLGGSSTF